MKPLKTYSTGYTFINSSGLTGQFGRSVDDFLKRDEIQQSLGKKIPENKKAKMRLYNCKNIQTSIKSGKKYVEIHESADNAPDMPAPCRKLLQGLPKTK